MRRISFLAAVTLGLIVGGCNSDDSAPTTQVSTSLASVSTTTEAPSLPDLNWTPALRPGDQRVAIDDIIDQYGIPILWPSELPGEENATSGSGRLTVLRLEPEPVMSLEFDHGGVAIRIDSLADSESTPCVVRTESPDWQATIIRSLPGCLKSLPGEPVVFEWAESQRFYKVTIEPGGVFVSDDPAATVSRLSRWMDDWTVARDLPQPKTSELSFGALTGTVRDGATSAPIPSVCVALFTDESTSPLQARTAADGRYVLDPVWEGTYRVLATDCSQFEYEDSWWGGAGYSGASALVIESGDAIQLDLEMSKPAEPSAAIVGTVRDELREPIEGICVEAYAGAFADGPAYTTRTGSNGAYTLGIDPGVYRLLFVDCGPFIYDAVWYPAGESIAGATPITVLEGNRIVADAGLVGPPTSGGIITGIISADGSGAPVANICIEAHATAGGQVTTVRSGGDGFYELGPLEAGDYQVKFVDCGPFAFVDEWFNNVGTQEQAVTIPVTSTSSFAADASLAPLGALAEAHISGRITDAAGNPIGFICVQAHDPADPDGPPLFTERTGTTGFYLLGVDAGIYVIRFIDCGPFQYQDSVFEGTVQVDAGQEASGVDAVLAIAEG